MPVTPKSKARNPFRRYASLLGATLFLTLGSPLAAGAETIATPDTTGQFLNGAAPLLHNTKLSQSAVQICYATFCAITSTDTHGAIATAERLTDRQVQNAMAADRSGQTFFPDPHLPASGSARSSDYTRSGYDRGHMAPWADSADPNCFTLANIVPQNPDNNRHLWEHIEVVTRKMARHYGTIFVVSGPIFYGHRPTRMDHTDVLVPTGFYKAIYIPQTGEASAYIVHNQPGDWWKPATLHDVQEITGTDVFPSLPEAVKTRLIQLPYPGERHGKTPPAPGRFTAEQFSAEITNYDPSRAGSATNISQNANPAQTDRMLEEVKKTLTRRGLRAFEHLL